MKLYLVRTNIRDRVCDRNGCTNIVPKHTLARRNTTYRFFCTECVGLMLARYAGTELVEPIMEEERR
jgi:hypothetical protein